MASRDNKINDVMNVCRLCLGTENLIWVFDNRIEIPQNMKDVIQVTTGVTVSPSDNVSQMLCFKCLHITIRMFKFRSSSIVNDMELKAKAAEKLNPEMDKSVELLLKKYPKIVLPISITKSDIAPVVAINENAVSGWLERYKRKRKIEKRKRKELKLAADRMLESEKIQLNVDLDKHITPYVIPNKENLPEFQPPEYIPDRSPPKLELVAPELRPTLLELAAENQLPSDKSICNLDDKESNNPPILSPAAPTEENKAKRKISLRLIRPKPKKFKSVMYDTNSDDSVDSLVKLNITKSLYICDICNSIVYTEKDLKKHKMKHMRCILCKRNFRSLEETKDHSENHCEIKHIMNKLPVIYLKRCDKVKEICDRYPRAFASDSSNRIESVTVSSLDHPEEGDKQKDPLEVDAIDTKQFPSSKSGLESVVEILLISDDEDEEIGCHTTKNDARSNKSEVVSNHKSAKNTSASISSLEITATDKKLPKQAGGTSTSSSAGIRPNIEIVGENILDVNLNDSDIFLLKNILQRTRRNVKESSIQTDMPCNNDIVPSLNKDKLFELKNLRKYLNFYKIPVNVSYATHYSVRYSFEPSPLLKKERSWSKMNTKIVTIYKKPSLVNNVPQTTIGAGSPAVSQRCSVITETAAKGVATNISMPPLLLLQNSSTSNRPESVLSSPVSETAAPLVPSKISIAPKPSQQNALKVGGTSTTLTNYYQANQGSHLIAATSNTPTYNSTILNYCLSGTNLPYQVPQSSYILLNNGMNVLPKANLTLNGTSMSPQNTINNLVTLPRNISTTAPIILPKPSVNSVMPSTTQNNIMPTTSPSNSKILPSPVNNIPSSSASPVVPQTEIMPPPLNSHVPQRIILPKSSTNNSQNSVADSQSKTLNPSVSSAAAFSGSTSNFVPMIRVKNVSELR